MKKPVGNNLRLGIFVAATIAAFITGIYFVGQRQQMFNSTFHVGCVFADIGGLEVGDNVRYSGINVGVVQSIKQITDSSVRVELVINESSRRFIKKNARAIIGTDGLMGNKLISIIPGPQGEKELSDNDVIETTRPISIDDIMLQVKVTATNAAVITGDLADIMDNIHAGRGTMGKLLMDSSFAQNMDKTLVNLKQGTNGFKKDMDAAGHSFLLKGFLRKKKDKDKDKNKDD